VYDKNEDQSFLRIRHFVGEDTGGIIGDGFTDSQVMAVMPH
jgi:hypothetical protein